MKYFRRFQRKLEKKNEMRELTEATMQGMIPFKDSFLRRVSILSDISVKEINGFVSQIPLNDKISNFIKHNHERCYVVTGNLDIWISGLMDKLNMQNHCFCSKAIVEDEKKLKNQLCLLGNKAIGFHVLAHNESEILDFINKVKNRSYTKFANDEVKRNIMINYPHVSDYILSNLFK